MVEEKDNILFKDALNTFYLQLHGLFIPIGSKGSFMCTKPTDRIIHNTSFVHHSWSTETRSRSVGIWGIDPTTHHIMMLYHEGRKEMFYLTTHSTHFIYGYMASDIWLRTILIVRKETRCIHIGYYFRLTARVILYAPSHRQDSTYHGLCYTSRGALAGTRNSSMGPPWKLDPTTHRTMSERSYHGATSRSPTQLEVIRNDH